MKLPAWLALVLLLALCLLVYGRVVSFGYTNWDDPTFITNNPHLQQADAASLRAIFTPGSIPHEVLYIPVTYLSFWLERAIFDLHPGAVHAGNLFLHLASVSLLWLLLRRRGVANLACFAGVAVFALHPLQVEAVAWCSGRKDLLATTFALLCLLAWQRQKPIPSLICLTIAIFAKPTLLVLPLLMLILVPESFHKQRPTLLAAASLCLVAFFLNHGSLPLPDDIPPLHTRLAHAPWIAGDTLGRFFLAGPNLHFYRWPETRSIGTLIGLLLATAAILGLLIGWRRRIAWLWTSIAFGLVALAPMAKLLFGYREFVTADRYTYFPMIAVAIFIGGLLSLLPAKRVPVAGIGLAAMILGFVVLDSVQVSKWRDSVSLWRDYLDSQRDAFGYHQLGRAIRAEDGDAEAALEALEAARAIGGDSAELYYDLGATYEDFRRSEAALDAYRQVLSRNPDFVEAIVNYANILLSRKEYADAIILYDRALLFDTPFRDAILANRSLAESALKTDSE
jgi:hypothetical protein